MPSQLSKARHIMKELVRAGHPWPVALERVSSGCKLTPEEIERLRKEYTEVRL